MGPPGGGAVGGAGPPGGRWGGVVASKVVGGSQHGAGVLGLCSWDEESSGRDGGRCFHGTREEGDEGRILRGRILKGGDPRTGAGLPLPGRRGGYCSGRGRPAPSARIPSRTGFSPAPTPPPRSREVR